MFLNISSSPWEFCRKPLSHADNGNHVIKFQVILAAVKRNEAWEEVAVGCGEVDGSLAREEAAGLLVGSGES